MVSARPYEPAAPAHVGVAVIVDGGGRVFSQEVVDAFQRIVMPHPVGTEVALPDGRRAIVCVVDPDDPHAAKVRVAGPDGPVEMRTLVTA